MVIQSKRVWIGEQFIPAALILENGKIEQIVPHGSVAVDVDYGDKRLLPGFIDVHTHGAYGYDTNDAGAEGLRNWVRRIPEEGVTALLPTTVTQLEDVLTAAVANVAKVAEEGYEGAEILGIHFEGPYLDMGKKGAQPPEAIVKPNVEQFKRYQKAAKGMIKYITLAPEHDEQHALTRFCAQNGVVVSMGHSNASFAEGMMGIANGATSVTHAFNGMSGFGSREPGLLGVAMRARGTYSECICDLCHSHVASLNVLFASKGKDYAMMVSDSLRAKHCPPGGKYTLGGHDIEIGEDGLARLKGTDTIAGSTLRMNQGLKNLIEVANIPVAQAINSCTINPASCLGVSDRKGRLMAGYDADIVVLADNYEVEQTYCRGRAML